MRDRSLQLLSYGRRSAGHLRSRLRILRGSERGRLGLALVVVFGLSSCAGGPSGSVDSVLSQPAPGAVTAQAGPAGQTDTAGPAVATGTGQPVKDEAFDCGRVTGRMQVRILQIRDYNPSANTSGLSRTLQGFSTGLFGGTSQGLQPDAQYRRDVAELTAQNERLRAHGCKTYDLERELKSQDITHTPRPR